MQLHGSCLLSQLVAPLTQGVDTEPLAHVMAAGGESTGSASTQRRPRTKQRPLSMARDVNTTDTTLSSTALLTRVCVPR